VRAGAGHGFGGVEHVVRRAAEVGEVAAGDGEVHADSGEGLEGVFGEVCVVWWGLQEGLESRADLLVR